MMTSKCSIVRSEQEGGLKLVVIALRLVRIFQHQDMAPVATTLFIRIVNLGLAVAGDVNHRRILPAPIHSRRWTPERRPDRSFRRIIGELLMDVLETSIAELLPGEPAPDLVHLVPHAGEILERGGVLSGGDRDKLPSLGLEGVHRPNSGRTSSSVLPDGLLLRRRPAERASSPCIPINFPTYVAPVSSPAARHGHPLDASA